jgi:hypothetical protein
LFAEWRWKREHYTAQLAKRIFAPFHFFFAPLHPSPNLFPDMTALQSILAKYRATSQSEREKGTYFEELIRTYFRYVRLFADSAKENGFNTKRPNS